MPSGEVLLDPPPETPTLTGRGWQTMLTMLPMAAGTAAMGLMMGGQRGGTMAYVTGGMYGVSVLGMIGAQVSGQTGGRRKREMAEARRQYLRQLNTIRVQMRRTIELQRTAAFYRHPDPDALWSTASSARLWERRREDSDFGVIRLGVGPQPIATPLVPPQTRPVDELEPLTAQAVRRFVDTYGVLPDLPLAVALRDFSRVYIRGAEPETRALARALLAQLTVFHSPEDLLVACGVAEVVRPEWDWVKWLPHALHPSRRDAAGPVRLCAPGAAALEAMLEDLLANRGRFTPSASAAGPYLAVVNDHGDPTGSDHLMVDGGVDGVTVLDLSTPPPRVLDESSLVLTLAADGALTGTTMERTVNLGRADRLDRLVAEVIARVLSPLRLSAAATGDRSVATDHGLLELLGLGDPDELDLATAWAARRSRDRLRVPIGVGVDGRQVELDLKESAQDGMGPHGLLIGATGSGKSELLRTLVLALAVTHSPEILNFVLVDFKGGATFTRLDGLPHTSAVITNLADELSLVDRMLDAIQGELVRRQELLRSAGTYASQRDYERARTTGVPLEPLPSLLLVCDEFSELLTVRPDFLDMFVQIGRLGRSLGVHLLLASQRLDEGRLRGLETHLSYRIGLRSFSSMESRAVLGVPDAYELPRSPGHGYLKAGTEGLVRFKAAYVSGPSRRPEARDSVAAGEPVLAYTTQYRVAPSAPEAAAPVAEAGEAEPAEGETLLDVVVARLRGQGTPARRVWLPPLAEPSTLDQLLPPLVVDPVRGYGVADARLLSALTAVVGVVDRPFEQRRDQLQLDLSGAGGNVLVVGGPQSGKSTLLRTLIASLALTHTPAEVQCYGLDFGGGALASLGGLPHLGGVASRRDPARVRRTVAEMMALLVEREERFAANGIDGMATYRRLRQAGQVADDPYGDVFLVVDGWTTVRADYESLEAPLTELGQRGLGFGIHLIVSAARSVELRPGIRDTFGTRLELRLGDPSDSGIDRRSALAVPEQTPGRGLTPEGYHFLGALPRCDSEPDVPSLALGVTTLVERARLAWTGPTAPPVRLLPELLPDSALDAVASPNEASFPVGLAETDLKPVYLSFDGEPHLIVLGDTECGKSSLLRGLARRIVQRTRPEQARVILIDYRRSLLGCIDGDHLIGYGTSPSVTEDLIRQVTTVMAKRLPGPDVTAEQLRTRAWWTGPDCYLLVDDYDLVAGAANPLVPLLDYLAQGRDIGLRLVIARRVGGATRAMMDPVLSRLRDLGSPGVLMSGPRDEGPFFGNLRPHPLPPGRGFLLTRREGLRLVQFAHSGEEART
jgi:S-DNA-T family DNA segregation ATPase FtsK/SpoIIIE